jgi:DNA helicase-2/ATP-dependent DNA helicase PcrA
MAQPSHFILHSPCTFKSTNPAAKAQLAKTAGVYNKKTEKNMTDHLAGLNEAQKEAVLSTEGPLLVLAGAGAGKTKVIVSRILQIISQGVAPEAILAITFTNKAAAEMRERVLKALKPGDKRPFVSTFHSLGLALIKEDFRLLGLKRAPAIYDRQDSLREMKQVLKAIGAEEVDARSALGLASRHKGKGITAQEFAEAEHHNPFERHIALGWLKYEEALRKDCAMDFDDLLLRAVHLLEKNPELHKKYQARWRYLLIDEYQDTNHIQARLASLLVGPEKNVCAVGDIDQTIYSWRGAEIANIISFERRYPGARVIMLEENYRSTQTILRAANDVIALNRNRPEKVLRTKNTEGAPIGFYQAFNEIDEAGFVARIVKEKLAAGAQPKNFAVLYRANFQSRALEEQFLAADIPYQVLGTRFFERKEVKDVLSFIRAALFETPADVARVANVPPRGIGKVTLLKMLAGTPVGGALGEKVAAFKRLLSKIANAVPKLPPAELVKFVIVESGLEAVLKADKLEGAERLENLRELMALASRYENTEKMLEDATLQSEQDELKEEKNAVRLMTVHAAKGLEFPTVFITGLEEGLFPYESTDEDRDQEEERRLMYVALTRAKEKLYLTYASYRTVFGAQTATEPSQFLRDVPGELMELESPERLGKTIYLE